MAGIERNERRCAGSVFMPHRAASLLCHVGRRREASPNTLHLFLRLSSMNDCLGLSMSRHRVVSVGVPACEGGVSPAGHLHNQFNLLE